MKRVTLVAGLIGGQYREILHQALDNAGEAGIDEEKIYSDIAESVVKFARAICEAAGDDPDHDIQILTEPGD